jgi:hypothetical protein
VKVVASRPPNYDEVAAAFGLKGRHGVIFAYGDTIYNPSGIFVTPDLVAHETVHSGQQAREGGPEAWWRRYIDDPAFRLEQEVEAYRAQYRFAAENYGRKQRRDLLAHICRTLAGPLYGRVMTPGQARAAVE